MNLLSLTNIGKTLSSETLFSGVTLGIDEAERIGFIGRNGSGKSTFLSIISGKMEPDSGTIHRNRLLRTSMMEQRLSRSGCATLRDFFFQSDDPVIRLVKEYHGELEKLHVEEEPVSKKLEELTAAMEQVEGLTVEHSFNSYCSELGLPGADALIETFSEGMLKKAALARCLSVGGNLVLLDEPTNHLDLDTTLWLEKQLQNRNTGFVLVTHDRRFLDAVCTSIIEIAGERILKYPGTYTDYLNRKAEREEEAERTESRRNSVLRRELEWLRRGPKARTGKDKSRKARIMNLMDAETKEDDSMQEFSSAQTRMGKKVLELSSITKAYGGNTVISPFSFTFQRRDKIGIIGPNGSGKSTFLRMVAGETALDSGSIIQGETIVFAFFDQTGSFIDGAMTVLDYVKAEAERVRLDDGANLAVEQFLERFLFPRRMLNIPLAKLSGGEFRRLYLIRLLASSPNFLLLDEPTNDLDIDTIRLLESYLIDFNGCILMVSHDRVLLERVTDRLFVFNGTGEIRDYTGAIEGYGNAATERSADTTPAKKNSPQKEIRKKRNQLSFKERKEFETLFLEIEELENEQKSLETFFQSPGISPMELDRNNRRYKALCIDLEVKMRRWEELAEWA
jgi:ABC transport system ATP-binding/permease protein